LEARQIYHDSMMLTASLIWGGAFVAQKAAMEHMGPLQFNGLRFLLGAMALVGAEKLALLRGNPLIDSGQEAVSLRGGLLAGLALFGAATLQQIGLLFTTAGKAGFITGLYVVMVPLVCFFLGRRPSVGALLGGLSAGLGLYLLSGQEVLEPQRGDLWVLLSALLWSLHVLLLAHFSPKTDPLALAKIQDMVCSVLSLAAAVCLEDLKSMELILAWKELFYGGVISVGVAYTLQVAAQRRVHPAHAAVLLSMEGFFAALAGYIFLGEVMGFRELTGGFFMLLGVLMAQLWRGSSRAASPKATSQAR
jgi:drug/metabolite transporter (DMT)-like permease